MQPIHAGRRIRMCRTFDLPTRQSYEKIESGSGERDRRDGATSARVLDQMFVNLGGRRKALKISDQASQTWPCVWPENRADESTAHRSARDPQPACRIGPAAAAIEIERSHVIESVLAKHSEMDGFG